MTEMDRLLEQALNAQKIYKQIKETDSMPEISNIIESLDEETSKLVLKMFVYA